MRRTIVWILYILMGVQIAFGCVYLVTGFTAEQKFAENIVTFLPAGVLYMVQLAAAAGSAWYFLGKMGLQDRRARGYLCAFLLTVPFFLQMHLAKLAWSLSLSALLWMLGLVVDIRKKGMARERGVRLLISYFLYGIICPDGLWLGGILLLTVLSRSIGRGQAGKTAARRRFCLAVFVTAAVIFLTNAELNAALPKQRRIYRENNPGTAAVSRFVWPNFATNYFFWSDEVKAVLSEEEAIDVSERIDLLEKEFYPSMRETYGSGKATLLCLEMGYRCLMDRSRETVLEIVTDFKDYLLIPFTVERNLQGRGVSLTAWNYGRMKEQRPLLVKYYYRYGLFELPLLLLGSLLLWGFQKSDRNSQWKLLLYMGFLYTLWYTMKSNLPIDYKQVLPILFIWYLVSVWGIAMKRPVSRSGGEYVGKQRTD